MDCKHCGCVIEEGIPICPNCGQSVSDDPIVVNSNDDTIISEQCESPDCVSDLILDDSAPDTACEDRKTCKTTKKAKKKSKLKKGLIITGIILFVLIVGIVIAGLLTDWFGLYGPLTQISSAASKTLGQYNYTVDFVVEKDNETKVDGTLYLDMNIEDEIVNMFLSLNFKKSSYIIAVYDDHLIYGQEDDLNCKEISFMINSICDSIEQNQNSKKSLEEQWDDLIDMIPNKYQKEINEEYINLNTLKHLIVTSFLQKQNNSKWLKEHAGYSKEKEDGVTMYTFRPDFKDFLETSVEHFEDAFVDEELYEKIYNGASELGNSANGSDIQITFGVQKGMLVSVEVKSDSEDSSFRYSCEFSRIGKTKISEDDLEDLLDEAKMNYKSSKFNILSILDLFL